MPKLSKSDQQARVSQNEARRRKEVALARLREMEADQRAGRLIASEDVKDAWVKILTATKTGILRLPDKLTSVLAATSDVREARALLMNECESVLKELHDELRYTDR